MHRQADGAWKAWIWSPDAQSAALLADGRRVPMTPAPGGGWHATADHCETYLFEVDGRVCPDPASRDQAGSVESPSRACPPAPAPRPWAGHDFAELSILELHLGTFTDEGTLRAAQDRLPAIAGLGLTAVELMPVAQFPGEFGWGYDGVLPFAIHPAYGTRDDLRAFVEAAHDAGLSVILDVVYNHFGPVGAPLHALCPAFFHAGRTTPWGPAIDFSHPAVREYFLQNAEMWIAEFGIDGLRIDAAHQIRDESDPHFLNELAGRARASAPGRPVHMVLEDERNLPALRQDGGYDAQWNDDYHHALHCLLTGEDDGYYASFAVDPLSDLCVALAEGHVEQGQPRPGRDDPRGAPSWQLPPTAFVNANQTHDQIGNRAAGDRLIALAGPAPMRVAHALLLTSPAIPMLFMGEEAGSRAPFQFFADYDGEMGETVRAGRQSEFAAFGAFTTSPVPDPTSPATWRRSRPCADLPHDHRDWRALTARALAFRTAHVVPLLKSGRAAPARVTPIGEAALHAHWRFHGGTLETVARFFGGSDPLPEWPDAALRFHDPDRSTFFATRITP